MMSNNAGCGDGGELHYYIACPTFAMLHAALRDHGILYRRRLGYRIRWAIVHFERFLDCKDWHEGGIGVKEECTNARDALFARTIPTTSAGP